MIEEFVSFGKWWLPNNPEFIVLGELSFSPNTGATLKLIGSFYSSDFEEIGETEDINWVSDFFPANEADNVISGVPMRLIEPKETIILGSLDNNEEITLYRCSGKIMNWHSDKEATFSFDVQYVFRKIHFKNEQDISFKSISVQYSNLREWVGKSGVQVIVSEENQLWISYKPPSNIHLTEIDTFGVDITFSQIYLNPFDVVFGAKYYKANIEQKTYLTVQNSCNQPLDECIKLIINFRDLLSFAMTKPTSVIEVTGKTDVTYTKPVLKASGQIELKEEQQETQVIILFGLLWNSDRASKIEISTNKMLFRFSDVENNLGEVFEAWINKREIYEPIFDLLLATMYTPNLYLHHKFLNIIQALEAYHTNKYEGIYQDGKVYEKGLYEKFKEVLKDFPSESVDPENGISDEFRNALKGKLKAQTRFTLETRLKELLGEVSSLLPNDFIGSANDRDSFARRAADTRNALTHHDKEKRKQAAKGQELFQLFRTLTVILQICLMKEINLTDDSIKALVERTL
jgi:hypothetical protein